MIKRSTEIKINDIDIQIIDDFFSQKDFENLVNAINEKKINKIKVLHNTIDHNGKIIKCSINYSLLRELHNNYHSKVMQILKNKSPLKYNLYEYSDYTFIITNKNVKFPIHDDAPDKLLSGVIYLSPKKNTGTSFYSNKDGDNKKTIEWKQNKAVFFSRLENQSWHSYEGDGTSDRLVLVYNLKTTNLKKIYKIENKNYILGMLRLKINPYLYRFFNLTI